MSNSRRSASTVKPPSYTFRLADVESDAIVLDQEAYKKSLRNSVFVSNQEIMKKKADEDLEKKAVEARYATVRTGIIEADIRRKEAQQQQEAEEKRKIHEEALAIALSKADEELDEVKSFNADVMAARVRAIRDKQVEFNIQTAEKLRQENKIFAQMFEARRQAAVKIYQDREIALREQKTKGREQIEEQVRIKHEQRRQEEELRRRNREASIAAAAAMKEEDQRLFLERKARQEEFLNECMIANKMSLLRKQREKEEEREEQNSIWRYQQEKAAREEEHERKIQEDRKKQLLAVIEARKLQSRAVDTQAQLDELRARRIQEEKERKERAKELEEVKKQERIREEARINRELGIKMKEKRMYEMARLEKEEFDKANKYNEEQRKKWEAEEAKKKDNNKRFMQDLLKEVQAKRIQKSLEPLESLDEQKHLQELNQDYIERLEMIKQRKIDQLVSEKVPEKYIDDLRNKKIVLK